jgi:hypothetical protein
MGSEIVQTAIVGLVVLAAAAMIVRRVLGFVARDPQPKCANCVPGEASATPSRPPAADAPARPLTFVRSPRR